MALLSKNIRPLCLWPLLLLALSCSRSPLESRKEFTSRGDGFVKQEKYKEAIIEYRNAIQAMPRYAPSYYKAALAYLKVEEYRAAFEHLTLLVSFGRKTLDAAFQEPDFGLVELTNAHIILGEIYLRAKQANAACELLRSKQMNHFLARREEALKQDGSGALKKKLIAFFALKARVLSSQWRVLTDQDDAYLADAMIALKKAIALDDDSVSLYLLYVDIINHQVVALERRFISGPPLPNAGESLVKAAEARPDDPVAKLVLAEWFHRQLPATKDPERRSALLTKITEALRKAIRCDESRQAQLSAAYGLIKKLAADDAAPVPAVYQAIAGEVPDNPVLKASLGLLHLQLKDKDKAIFWLQEAQKELIDRAIKVDPSSTRPKIVLARFHGQNKAFDRAEKVIQDALKMHPEDQGLHLELAGFYENQSEGQDDPALKAGFIKKAEAILIDLVKKHPKTAKCYLKLGEFYRRQNDLAGAEKTYQALAGMDPGNASHQKVLGLFYATQRMYAKAIPVLKVVCSKSPDDGAARNLLAMMYIESGDIAGARGLLPQIKAGLEGSDPDRSLTDEERKQKVDVLFLKARIAHKDRDYHQMANHLDEILADMPEHAGANHYRGVLYLKERKTEAAKKAFQVSLKSNPRRLAVREALIRIHLLEQEPDAALKHLAILLRADPANAAMHILNGNAFLLKTMTAEATAAYRTAAGLTPDKPEPYFRLAMVRTMAADTVQALVHLDKVLSLKEDHFGAIAMKAMILQRDGAYDKAIGFLEKTLAAQEGKGKVFKALVQRILGNVYVASQDLDKGKEAFQKAIDLDPGQVDAYVALARLCVTRGETEMAIAHYSQALEKDPDYLQGYMAIGTIYEALGDGKAARRSYERLLAAAPDFVPAANNLAWLLLQAGDDPDKALALSEKAKGKLPGNPAVSDTLGAALLVNGEFASALHELLYASQKLPDNPIVRYHLALAYIFNGRSDKGMTALKASLQGMFSPALSEAEPQ